MLETTKGVAENAWGGLARKFITDIGSIEILQLTMT